MASEMIEKKVKDVLTTTTMLVFDLLEIVHKNTY